MSRIAAIALACVALADQAYAEPGGTSGVSGPRVTEGAFKLEVRTAAFLGDDIDGSWSHRALAAYGVTSWWRTQLNLRASQPDGEDAELRSVGIENAFDFTATRDWPVHFGGQIEYRFGVNGADDNVELKLLSERDLGPVNVRFNLIADRDVGSGASDEWEHGYAVRAMWDATDAIELGIEGLGELDIDAHAFGPRASFDLGAAAISLGYLASFGDDAEADGQVRVGVEWSP